LGAAKVIAIDNDDWSVTNASENLQLNRCFKTELKKSDIIPGRQKFDVILANINKKVILDNFSLLTDKLKTRGVLLLSGFLREDEKDVLKEAGKFSIQADKITENNNWICIRFNR
jgi:ribosomal protein L11 methyltransferase